MKNSPPNSSDVRAWARKAGLEVGERGRLSPAVLAAYDAAHGGKPLPAGAPVAKKATSKRPAKKAAKKTAAKSSARPTQRAAARPALTERPATPVRSFAPPSTPTPAAPAVEPSRVTALEEQLRLLAGRVERLEVRAAAPQAAPRKGLFGRKK